MKRFESVWMDVRDRAMEAGVVDGRRREKEKVVMKVGREEKLYGKRAGGDAGSGRGKSRLQINLGDAAALIWLRREDQRDGSRVPLDQRQLLQPITAHGGE